MTAAILASSCLLLAGFVLRARLRVLQLFFVPASVTGGLVGLLAIQGALRIDLVAAPVEDVADTLRSWPGPLIAVVFAGLLLERPSRRLRDSLLGAAQAGLMVWIIVLGQIAIGLAATWLLIHPAYDVPNAFGQLLEGGFAGGHGSATALGEIFSSVLHFPEGLDLGLFVATFGLVFSVVSGLVLINIGVRRGWTRSGRVDIALVSGLEQRTAPKPLAYATVRSEVVDPLAFQILIVALAYLLGALLRKGFIATAGLVAGDGLAYLDNLPLFLFTLLGGWLLRGVMGVAGVGDLIDTESVRRLVAIAMEFLIVAAIATLRLEVVATYLWPLCLLCGLGCAWSIFCLVGLSRSILPRDHWFELGIINYGMSTGTTAQGMMLLRIIDKDLESGAAENYALAAPLSAPFVGGGVLTLSLPVLLIERVSVPVVVTVLSIAVVALIVAGRSLAARDRAA